MRGLRTKAKGSDVNENRFDRLTRMLTAESPRRAFLALPTTGFAVTALAAVSDAKKRKKKKKKRCKGGQVRCGKRCANTATDKGNCGKCGSRCQGELTCVEGACGCQLAICRLSAFESDDSPGDLAVNAEGNIVTAMYFEDKVSIFSPAGQLLREVGDFGDEPGEFDGPNSVAVAEDGTLFVADTGNSRIQKIAPNGGIEVWTFDGSPQGVAVSSSGAIYASISGQLHRLTESGQVSYSWGPGGTETSEFDWPGDVAVDSGDDVYVVDEDANLLYRFTDDGAGNVQQVWVSGGSGTDPGEFNLPSSVAVSAGRVFVADEDNFRIQALDAADGSFLFERVINDEGFEQYAVGVAAAQNGNIYVATFTDIATFEVGTG